MRLASLLFVGLSLILAGCERGATSQDKPVSEPKNAVAAKPTEAPLKLATWEQTQEFVAGQKGKIVVLDLWSTYCPPCLKELPELVKLHEKHQADVVCVSLNCNFDGLGSPDDNRADVLKVLNDRKAFFQNLMASEEAEVLNKKVGIASIPVVQVYGRDGKLAKQFDNEKDEYGADGFTYEKHIAPFVEKLIAEK